MRFRGCGPSHPSAGKAVAAFFLGISHLSFRIQAPRSPQRGTFRYPGAKEPQILVCLKQDEGKLVRRSFKLLTRTCEFYYISGSDSLGWEWGMEVRLSN